MGMNKKEAIKEMVDCVILYHEGFPDNNFSYAAAHSRFRIHWIDKSKPAENIDINCMPREGWSTEEFDKKLAIGSIVRLTRYDKNPEVTDMMLAQVAPQLVTPICLDTGNRFMDIQLKSDNHGRISKNELSEALKNGCNVSQHIELIATTCREYFIGKE